MVYGCDVAAFLLLPIICISEYRNRSALRGKRYCRLEDGNDIWGVTDVKSGCIEASTDDPELIDNPPCSVDRTMIDALA